MKQAGALPSGKTILILRQLVVSLMIEALSSCEVMAEGSGSSLASSQNSLFSFSRRVRAAFFDFSFILPFTLRPSFPSLSGCHCHGKALSSSSSPQQLASYTGSSCLQSRVWCRCCRCGARVIPVCGGSPSAHRCVDVTTRSDPFVGLKWVPQKEKNPEGWDTESISRDECFSLHSIIMSVAVNEQSTICKILYFTFNIKRIFLLIALFSLNLYGFPLHYTSCNY